MTALEIVLGRIGQHKRQSRGWLARCPAHDDRGPSLSIGIGREGRVLLNCFAGCAAVDVAARLGLRPQDLFEHSDREAPRTSRAPATPAEIRTALELAAREYRADRGVRTGETLLTFERNEIRRRVAVRFSISLPPAVPRLSEGSYGGRERDPRWSLAFERAWSELWFEAGQPAPYSIEQRARTGPPLPPRSIVAIEDRAVAIFHSFTLPKQRVRVA